MTAEISAELFTHLVELAALELTAQEAEYLRKELNNQLVSIDQLAAIPLDDSIEPASHGVPYHAATSPALREDMHIPCKDAEAILEQVPDLENDYIVVPDIPHEELD